MIGLGRGVRPKNPGPGSPSLAHPRLVSSRYCPSPGTGRDHLAGLAVAPVHRSRRGSDPDFRRRFLSFRGRRPQPPSPGAATPTEVPLTMFRLAWTSRITVSLEFLIEGIEAFEPVCPCLCELAYVFAEGSGDSHERVHGWDP